LTRKEVLFALPSAEKKKEEFLIEKIKKEAPNIETHFVYGPEEIKEPEKYEIILTFFYPWLKKLLPRMKNLRWVHFLSAGVDRVWDWGLDQKDYVMSKSTGVHSETISDHVLAMALYFARELARFEKQKREKKWKRHSLQEMEGKTMGILGLGHIGRACARKARAFNMEVIAMASRAREDEEIDRVLGPEGLDEILKQSDYLVIALPLTSETKKLIGGRELDLLGENSVVINIGRGEIIDEEALIEVLKEGRIKGAGMDVFEEEPLSEDSPLWDLENVLITPHVAGTTPVYMERVMEIFLKNLEAYEKGEKLPTGVDLKKGY